MKKNLSVLLILALLLPVFAGCQSANSANSAGGQKDPQATTGAIVPTPTGTTPNNTTEPSRDAGAAVQATTAAVTPEQAQQIALDHAGFTADQVMGLRTELDRDDGIVHYDVEFHQGQYEYDYEIHAQTGQILKSEKERD